MKDMEVRYAEILERLNRHSAPASISADANAQTEVKSALNPTPNNTT